MWCTPCCQEPRRRHLQMDRKVQHADACSRLPVFFGKIWNWIYLNMKYYLVGLGRVVFGDTSLMCIYDHMCAFLGLNAIRTSISSPGQRAYCLPLDHHPISPLHRVAQWPRWGGIAPIGTATGSAVPKGILEKSAGPHPWREFGYEMISQEIFTMFIYPICFCLSNSRTPWEVLIISSRNQSIWAKVQLENYCRFWKTADLSHTFPPSAMAKRSSNAAFPNDVVEGRLVMPRVTDTCPQILAPWLVCKGDARALRLPMSLVWRLRRLAAMAAMVCPRRGWFQLRMIGKEALSLSTGPERLNLIHQWHIPHCHGCQELHPVHHHHHRWPVCLKRRQSSWPIGGWIVFLSLRNLWLVCRRTQDCLRRWRDCWWVFACTCFPTCWMACCRRGALTMMVLIETGASKFGMVYPADICRCCQ